MIRHLFRLIWNRKKTNALITVEILCSFLVLFAVITGGFIAFERYHQPLGFDYRDVWMVDIDTRLPLDSASIPLKRETIHQLLLALRGMNEIGNFCSMSVTPYSNNMSTWGGMVSGKLMRIAIEKCSESTKDVLGMHLVQGRWFEAGDGNQNWIPVVVNSLLAKDRFGDADPIGKNPFPKTDEAEKSPPKDYRIVGVVDNFKKGGEFSEPMYTVFEYFDAENTTLKASSTLLVKVNPGVTASFKEKLTRTMEATAKGWSFDVRTLEEMRKEDFKPRIALMIVTGLVAGFLLLMVALGLLGVMWQNVSRRTQEIGLRRALGGTEGGIYAQILGELLVLTTFGLIVGSLVIVQFPLLDLLSFVSLKDYGIGFLVSVLMMYLLTAFCGLYPSLLAIEIEPAEALHYE